MPVKKTTNSVQAFSAAARKWSDKLLPEQYAAFKQKLALELLRRVVLKTPVDTGRARGGWQVAVGKIPTGGDDQPDSTGHQTILAGAMKLRSAPLASAFLTAYVANNVSYIRVLEEGGFVPADPGPSKDPRKGRKGRVLVKGGYSVQAPQGMLAVSLQELGLLFK